VIVVENKDTNSQGQRMAPVSPLNDIKQVRTGQSTRPPQLIVPQKVVYIPFSPPGKLSRPDLPNDQKPERDL
jgi:hypothetical protein